MSRPREYSVHGEFARRARNVGRPGPRVAVVMPPADVGADGMSRLRVVVIDDAEHVRDAVVALIRHAGHELVGQAGDGASGVHETLAQRRDLVIMDWSMQGMDGIEATRRIRASYAGAAIVAFCSNDAREIRDAFMLSGADASWTNGTSKG